MRYFDAFFELYKKIFDVYYNKRRNMYLNVEFENNSTMYLTNAYGKACPKSDEERIKNIFKCSCPITPKSVDAKSLINYFYRKSFLSLLVFENLFEKKKKTDSITRTCHYESLMSKADCAELIKADNANAESVHVVSVYDFILENYNFGLNDNSKLNKASLYYFIKFGTYLSEWVNKNLQREKFDCLISKYDLSKDLSLQQLLKIKERNLAKTAEIKAKQKTSELFYKFMSRHRMRLMSDDMGIKNEYVELFEKFIEYLFVLCKKKEHLHQFSAVVERFKEENPAMYSKGKKLYDDLIFDYNEKIKEAELNIKAEIDVINKQKYCLEVNF